MSFAARGAREPAVATALLLALALGIHYYTLAPYLGRTENDFDALHLYFPLARGLLEHGIGFFATEKSVQAPPLSFIYPALVGATLPALKAANALLSGITLLAVFRSGCLLHSRTAGLVGAFLFAASPLLRPHLASPITEPPYILLGSVWFWGLAEWVVHRRGAALAASAVGLCLAALTRATMFYWIVALVVACGVASCRARGDLRVVARAAFVAYAACLVPMALLAAKNWVLFGFGFYVTGAGNALYLGISPLTGGYDPNYLGLAFDVGAIARDQSFLTLEAERLLKGVAYLILGEKSVPFLAELHARKLAAFLFVTSAEPDALLLRSWRIVLLVAAVFALPWRTGGVLRWLLFAMLAYQVAILAPAVYTHRYSVGGIDLWLVMAAAIGIAELASKARRRLAAIAIAAAAVGVVAGAAALRIAPAPMPDVFASAHVRAWEGPAREHRFNGGGDALDLQIVDASLIQWWMNHVLVLDVANLAASPGGCERLQVSFMPAGGARFGPAVTARLVGGEKSRRYQLGLSGLQMAPAGTLRLEMPCAGGSRLRIDRIAVYGALGAIDYRARLLGESLPLPVER